VRKCEDKSKNVKIDKDDDTERDDKTKSGAWPGNGAESKRKYTNLEDKADSGSKSKLK
jgi:hypothetical protein